MRSDFSRGATALGWATLLSLAGVLWMTEAAAQTRSGLSGVTACRFEGWSNDAGDAGQSVRAEPNEAATVIGRLPPPVTAGLDELSMTVAVTGYRDGWFRVEEAGYAPEVQGVTVPRRPVLKATGWVPVSGVKALVASSELKARPDRGAPVVASLQGVRRDGAGGQVGFTPDQIAVRRLIACAGSWVELETEFGTGWVERVCARQLSACP
jgi:SH3-like domain-containing protein